MSGAQDNPARTAYEGAYFGFRGGMLLLLGLVALGVGFWILTRHHATAPESMSSDSRPRLADGTIASGASISVAEALERRTAHSVAVHGYLEAAADDWPYLCARLNGATDCSGVPHLRLGGHMRWLLKGPDRLRDLDTGCCSIGSWSPHPVVLRGKVRERTLLLFAPSG
jgi:hypothetical protein